MRFFLTLLVLVFGFSGPVFADLAEVLDRHQPAIEKASRKTIDPVLQDMIAEGGAEAPAFLEAWREKNVWMRRDDKAFFYVETDDRQTYRLIDPVSGAVAGEVEKKALRQLKPNSGVRAVIAAALVQFQLSDPDPARRSAGLYAIERDPEESHLAALRASLETETDPALKVRKERLERLLTIQFDPDEAARIDAIGGFEGDLGLDVRA
ncbi:MAG: urea ABC transporter permease subunit UrtB, partial [Pseudomonadota bacterium]